MRSASLTPWRLLLQLAWSGLSAQPLRSLACLLAILVGVALGYAIHLINDSAVNEFSHATSSLSGEADLTVKGSLPDTLYPVIVRDPAVAAASPALEIQAHLPGRNEPLQLIGLDALRAAKVVPRLLGQPAAGAGEGPQGLTLLQQDAIFLSPAAMRWLQLAPGQALTIQVGLQDVRFTVVGSLPAAGTGQRLAVVDIAAAQWRLKRLGELSRIDVKLKPGSNLAEFRQRWLPRLPAGGRIDTPTATGERSANMSRAYRVNLAVLGLVALFTGSFLVFSTQVLSLLRRRSQLALLRVLGLRRRELMTVMLLEALALGSVGSGLGIAAGLLIADTALKLLGADLGGGFFNGVTPSLHVSAWALAGFFLLGLLATLAGSLVPAWEAAAAKPARALKSGDEETAFARARTPWPGVVLIALAGLLLPIGPVSELPIPGYSAIACLLVGALWLMPWLTAQLLAATPERWREGPIAGLALTQLKEAPGYAGIGLAGILASFSLMVAMAIMVASFRDSVTEWLGQVLPADMYLRPAASGDTVFLSPAEQALVRATAGVKQVAFQRLQVMSLDPARPGVVLQAREFTAAEAAERLPLVNPALPLPSDTTPVWVSEAVADLYGAKPGSRMQLPVRGKALPVQVAGIWRDYASQHGSIVMTLADYRRLTGDQQVNNAALWLDGDAATVQAALRQRLTHGERLEFALPGDLRKMSLQIFDRSFAVTYLLEAVAVLVGLLGIGVSFGGQALARLREFGMLRHIGFRQRDIDRLLAVEGASLAGIGVVAGLLVGWMISRILIDVVNPQSFHWTMRHSLPLGTLLMVSLALIALAALTAVLAGRRALRVGAVRAVKEDW